MQKTKLGISVGLLGAAIYVAGLAGGYIPALLLVGYVLWFEENEWLKKAAVKAIAVMMCVSFFTQLIGLIPDAFSWLSSLLGVVGLHIGYSWISTVVSVFTKGLDFLRTVVMLILAAKALKQGTIKIPFVDSIIEKYM